MEEIKQKNSRTEFGERLALARKRAGLSQKQLGEFVGVKQQVIAIWERKSEAVTTDTLKKLAIALDVTSDELIGLPTPSRDINSPKGKTWKLFTEISALPVRQKQKILDVIEAFVGAHQI